MALLSILELTDKIGLKFSTALVTLLMISQQSSDMQKKLTNIKSSTLNRFTYLFMVSQL